MKKSNYILTTVVAPRVYLYYVTTKDNFLLLNEKKHQLFLNNEADALQELDGNLYETLVDKGFVISDEIDEYAIAAHARTLMKYDPTMYEVMLNTTLDCNLNCWYCYENRVAGSFVKEETLNGIKKHIQQEYNIRPFAILKVSFFGGEPFLCYNGIKELLLFAKDFCKQNNVHLIAGFTTNATLITQEHADFLKDIECQFQITLDGDREIHNRIKKSVLQPKADTYQQTLNALRILDKSIPNRSIAVRVNFDNRTLTKIDEIIADIDFLDRQKCFVILKKVWQIETEKVDKPLLLSAIQKFFDKKFLLDYYIMPKGGLCFAQRLRQVLFNYDGKVFKCTTISTFDDQNALGTFNETNGGLCWNAQKLALWMQEMQLQKCKECKWLPACYGICNKQLLANPGKDMCTFDAMNLTEEEFLLYSFKYHLLRNELLSSTQQ